MSDRKPFCRRSSRHLSKVFPIVNDTYDFTCSLSLYLFFAICSSKRCLFGRVSAIIQTSLFMLLSPPHPLHVYEH
ncbi:hypothetical protein PO909_007600, partial [Leuciscus waleckii]